VRLSPVVDATEPARPLAELNEAELEELVAALRAAIDRCLDARSVAPAREREALTRELHAYGRRLSAAKFEVWRRG
jgi:hypothetical protein